MFFIPLSQVESVELVVHALKAAGGAADCTSCPVRKVCMKQCLTIAASVEAMIKAGTLPFLGDQVVEEPAKPVEPASEPDKGGHLKRIK